MPNASVIICSEESRWTLLKILAGTGPTFVPLKHQRLMIEARDREEAPLRNAIAKFSFQGVTIVAESLMATTDDKKATDAVEKICEIDSTVVGRLTLSDPKIALEIPKDLTAKDVNSSSSGLFTEILMSDESIGMKGT